MPPVWKPQPIEVYRDWVDSIIEEASDLLTDWEANFINDIDIRLDSGPLTEAQANKLESIYTKYTS